MKNLHYINNARLLRLMEMISHYNYTMRYLEKDKNKAADAMPRLFYKEPSFQDILANILLRHTVKQLQTRRGWSGWQGTSTRSNTREKGNPVL